VFCLSFVAGEYFFNRGNLVQGNRSALMAYMANWNQEASFHSTQQHIMFAIHAALIAAAACISLLNVCATLPFYLG
jgi:riboflavin transporter FmnP